MGLFSLALYPKVHPCTIRSSTRCVTFRLTSFVTFRGILIPSSQWPSFILHRMAKRHGIFPTLIPHLKSSYMQRLGTDPSSTSAQFLNGCSRPKSRLTH